MSEEPRPVGQTKAEAPSVSGSSISYRWCPRPMPSLSACWRKAPMVRFISLDTLTTGVLAFEWAFRVRRSLLLQRLCFTVFLATLGM